MVNREKEMNGIKNWVYLYCIYSKKNRSFSYLLIVQWSCDRCQASNVTFLALDFQRMKTQKSAGMVFNTEERRLEGATSARGH